MRAAAFLCVAMLAQAQCPNPLGPENPLVARAVVTAWGDVLTLASATFPGQPAQVMSCTPVLATLPSISVSMSAGPSPLAPGPQPAPGPQIVFACAGLALLPQLACPDAFAIGLLAPGQVVGLWVGPAGLHVSDANSLPLGCTACYQDATMSAYPGEFPVALCSVGGACVPTWTGAPALPVVSVPAGCSAVQSVSQVVVTCP
jgi:hypothetical protein